ncbi:MAG: DMT family transporter [Giesbergeria sp.]
MQTSPRTAIVLTVFATLFWGANFSAGKQALSSMPPWTVSAERFVIAAAIILLYLAATRGIRWGVLHRNGLAFVALGVIGVAGFNGALFVGLQTSQPVTAALIMATTPLSASLVEAMLYRRWPSAIGLAGAAVSLVGVGLVLTNGALLHGGAVTFAAGDPVILLGSLCWAVYTVGCRVYVKDATPLETTAWTIAFGTLALLGFALVFEHPVAAMRTGSMASHLAIVFMGIAGSVLAYLFWTVGIAVRGPAQTALYFNFVPVFALLISIVQGADPGVYRVMGVGVTIVGVVLGSGAFAFGMPALIKTTWPD